MALGLACLGLNISIAVPIPLWGSDAVRKRLSETIGKNGGSLTHFDHPAQVQEIMECFPDSEVV